MTISGDAASDSTRRVRPWLAALLTFLGWGVGLYYARRTRAAIYVIAGQVLAIALIGGSLVTYLALRGPLAIPIVNPNGFSALDLIQLPLTAAVALGVWVFVAKHNTVVERASPVRLWGYLGIWLLPILGALLLALLVRFFLLQPYDIPAGSMRPTLQVGDYFVVQKWSYGYSRASFAPFDRILPPGRMFGAQPARGDVVVFKNRKDGNKEYVKRLIGLPGDHIQMIGGVLHINGEPVKKEFVEIGSDVCNGGDASMFRETLDNGVSYMVQECSGDEGGLDNVGPYIVPEGHYFMLGDNRDQSQDSRVVSVVGYISYDDLLGKVLLKTQDTE